MKSKYKKDNIAIFTIIIMVLFMSIIGIEVIAMKYIAAYTDEVVSKNNITDTSTNTGYDTSSYTFTEISISDEKYNISSMCTDGCNIIVDLYGYDYKYIIRKNNTTSEYFLDIVKDNSAIVEDKSLGTNIDNLSVFNYSNYLALTNIIYKSGYVYDYALIVDNRGLYDEFSSLEANEMEFKENSILYYYDICSTEESGNGRKVKAVRSPFNSTPYVLSSEVTTFEWCQ